MIKKLQKHPSGTLDYRVDWSKWLDPGDTIASATWTVPTGLTQPFPASSTTTEATVWLAGGADGSDYEIECSITTAQNRAERHSFLLVVRA